MRRRQLLELAALAAGDGAVLAAGTAGSLALGACQSQPAAVANLRSPGWTPAFFSREQALCTEALAELIIPEGNLPGALSANVGPFVESFVRDVFDDAEQTAFIDGLVKLDAAATLAHGRAFHRCTATEQAALFSALAAAPPAALSGGRRFSFLRSFRELCIRGFCNSRLGATRVLQYEPAPGEFQGCVSLASVGKAWATW